MLGYVLCTLISVRLLIWMTFGFFQRPIRHLKYHVLFIFQIVCMVDYIYPFKHLETTFLLWDESHFAVVDHVFHMFLDLICKNFSKKFCFYVHSKNCSVLVFGSPFYICKASAYCANVTSINELGSILSVTIRNN